MGNFREKAYLCGYFRYHDSRVITAPGWEAFPVPAADIAEYKKFYYAGFVDFAMSEDNGGTVGRFKHNVDHTVDIGGIPVVIKHIDLYLMPYGIAIYRICVEITSDSLTDFTWAIFLMREIGKWDREDMRQYSEMVLAPIREAAASLGSDSSRIVDNGNKLKVFQIVTADNKEDYGQHIDTTLFEVATLSKIGACCEHNSDSHSEEYVQRILKDNKLSIYNNWSSLALFDSFTIMGYCVKPWVLQTWENDYCGLIYIHSLFCKFYLFDLNTRFVEHPEDGESLEAEYHEFMRTCTFQKISYNFLPGEIDESIDRALDISEELQHLRQHIGYYNKQQAAKSSDRMDKMLAFLAVVTLLSTIWDFSCLVNAMIPFTSLSLTETAGYRLVASLMVLMLTIVIILMLRPRRSCD